MVNGWNEIRAWAEEVTVEAARQAGEMARGPLSPRLKADGTLVTDIDMATERFLRDAIAARFPDHAIYGEEFGREGRPDVPLWAIDPIDGTVNLANGLPHWGVSVGLVVAGEPVVGVTSFPLLGETYSAAKGQGATRNGEPLPTLPPGGPTTWEQAYAVCSHSARVVDFTKVPSRLRVPGSAALELCWTAAGTVRGCQSIGVSLWDVAAGLCIAREVGAEARWFSPTDSGGERWTADAMPRSDVPLVTAAPVTLQFLLERLALRSL